MLLLSILNGSDRSLLVETWSTGRWAQIWCTEVNDRSLLEMKLIHVPVSSSALWEMILSSVIHRRCVSECSVVCLYQDLVCWVFHTPLCFSEDSEYLLKLTDHRDSNSVSFLDDLSFLLGKSSFISIGCSHNYFGYNFLFHFLHHSKN